MQNGKWHTVRNDLHYFCVFFERPLWRVRQHENVRTPGAFSFFQKWKAHEWSLFDRRQQRWHDTDDSSRTTRGG